MKTITIPKRFGYPTLDITINGKEETFSSGVEISVEDSVAEAIENAIALAPELGVPRNRIAQLAEGSLKEITAEDTAGITTISSYAFYNNKSLTSIIFSSGIKVIESFAFYGCSSIESIRFGDSGKLESLGTNAFDWCAKLKSVYLPETPPILASVNAFANIKADCVFYCKTQASLDAYKSAQNWSALTSPYKFVVEENKNG